MNGYPESAPFAQGSETSRAAAERCERRGKASRERLIYDTLAQLPRSSRELVEHLSLPWESVSPRCAELKARGLIRPTGETRLTKYGNQSEVLEVCAPYSPKRVDIPSSREGWKRQQIMNKLLSAESHLAMDQLGYLGERALAYVREAIKLCRG